MAVGGPGKLDIAARQSALEKGEEIAKGFPFRKPSVDPFAVAAAESELIHLEGGDFRDCFDGRLSYHGERFLLVYNTRYNRWSTEDRHHPKVRFTVAHELGHFYLDRHREFLVKRRRAIESMTEFESNGEIERQADAFASGLLMPKFLLGPLINQEEDVTIGSIKAAASTFDVSLTSMMVRWTQLSHFPCAAVCVRRSQIQWGFVSEGFARGRLWRCLKGRQISSVDSKTFYACDPSLAVFREGSGTGYAHNWLEGGADRISVQEHYLVLPYSQCMMVFLVADDADIPSSLYEDDDQDI